MMLKGFHHVAYRCDDASETVEFYENVLGLKLSICHSDDLYRGEYCPYMHIFFELEDGSYIAFFDLPMEAPKSWDPNTPRWVQHLSFEVSDRDVLDQVKGKLEERGIEVYGPKNGPTVYAIYFFDPSGNRLELSVPHKLDKEAMRREAQQELIAWHQKKRTLVEEASKATA